MIKRTNSLLVAARILEVIALPVTAFAALWMRSIRWFGFRYLPVSKHTLLKIGVVPIRDHYYEPLINPKYLRHALSEKRNLPAIDFNSSGQIALLASFEYQAELLAFPLEQLGRLEYYYHNASFESGDSEYFYCLIRRMKPKVIIEVGSGQSTLMARNAINRNREEDPHYLCTHTCIEPYEQPWLEELGIAVIRRRVEDCDPEMFKTLGAGDILFIDSSHVLRPQGDVVFEMLEILPSLRSGVFIHIHDIFSPRDYLEEWVIGDIKLWNEQYLLEAFLSFNSQFRVIAALNFLTHEFPEELVRALPVLGSEIAQREPGSFWMERI